MSRSLPSTSVHCSERQVGGDDEAGAFVGPADDFEEELGRNLGARDVTEFIEDEEAEPFELLVEALELPVLPAFEELGDQSGNGEEADAPSLLTGGEGQGGGQVGLAGARVPDEEHVLAAVDVLAPDQLADQFVVDGRLGVKVERIERLNHGEPGGLDAPFGGTDLTVQRFPFRQPQEIGRIPAVVLCSPCPARFCTARCADLQRRSTESKKFPP